MLLLYLNTPTVAPLTGAWIETLPQLLDPREMVAVAPLTGAWIETHKLLYNDHATYAAPPTGAWIETFGVQKGRSYGEVAPLTGAWIETKYRGGFGFNAGGSHPSRVRGLKLFVLYCNLSYFCRTPHGCVD